MRGHSFLLVDDGGKRANLDAFSRLRVSTPHAIFDSTQVYDDNPLFMENVLTGSATATYVRQRSCTDLQTTTSSGDRAIRQSRRYFNYQAGKSHLVLVTFNAHGQQEGVEKRIGYFDDNDGFYLKVTGTTISLVKRSSVSGVVVETEVLQEDWNVDRFDGQNESNITLDLTKTQILLFDMQWLGVGAVRIGFVINGRAYYAHQFNHANSEPHVYIQTPNLPVRWELENTSAAPGGGLVEAICCSIMSEGGVEQTGITRSASRGDSPLSVGEDLTPLISIRLRAGYERQTVIPEHFSIISGSTADCWWRLVYNPTITGGASPVWTAASNAVEYDVTMDGVVSGGVAIDEGYISSKTDSVGHTLNRRLTLAASYDSTPDVLVLCGRPTSKSSAIMSAAITWMEVA
jgi:hypothetical protein